MFGLFKNHNIHYQADSIMVAINFKSAVEFKHSSQKALAEFKALEAKLRNSNTINRNSPERTQASKAKGNTDAVIAKLDALLPPRADQKNIAQRIAERKTGQDQLDELYSLYNADTEELSTQFNHIFTKNLNNLKQDLIAKFKEFEQTILKNSSKKFYQQLDKQNKLTPCRQVIQQIQQLISCAKTVSGVYASIAIGADVLAQMEVADDKSNTDSAADVFIDIVPKIIQSQPEMSLGTRLNSVGSAFQLELARNSLIAKLERYLNQRARLDKTNTTESNILHTYTPINRGFFYNKTLQNERLRIAATLLTRLKCMQLNDGTPITTPTLFANLLVDAINHNNACQTRHGRLFDKQGELAKQLEDMRLEMGRIYPEPVKGELKDPYLHEQLDLPAPKKATNYGTMQ